MCSHWIIAAIARRRIGRLLVELFARRDAALRQVAIAFGLRLRICRLREIALEIRFGLRERRLEGPLIQTLTDTGLLSRLVELDLTESHIQGNEATLAITVIFGGVELRIPVGWQIAFRGAPIFGGVEDKTRTARVDDAASGNLKTLVITGAVIFGGLEIKN